MATIAKTVGSFDKVLATCKTIGARYQPSVPELTYVALSQLSERAQQSLRAATEARIAYRMAVNNRKDGFKGMSKLAARIVRMMSACARGENSHVEDARRIKNRLSSPKKSQKSEEKTQSKEGTALATRSSGRLSYDQQMETLSNLIQLAEKLGNYHPVEADLTLKGLKQKLADLHAKSQAVAETRAVFKKAMLERDQAIYGKDGIRDITTAVRNYIFSAFGSISMEFAQVPKYKE
jgi:hypothetical protein